MPKPTIFVSHSHEDHEDHEDNAWCRVFVSALQRDGFDVWYDEKGLSGGAEWVRTLEHELETRDVYAIVLTPESWASRWVQQELHLAMGTHRKIVPIVMKGTQITGFLRNYQQIDATRTTADVAAIGFSRAIAAPTKLDRKACFDVVEGTMQQHRYDFDRAGTICIELNYQSREIGLARRNNPRYPGVKFWLDVARYVKPVAIIGYLTMDPSSDTVLHDSTRLIQFTKMRVNGQRVDRRAGQVIHPGDKIVIASQVSRPTHVALLFRYS